MLANVCYYLFSLVSLFFAMVCIFRLSPYQDEALSLTVFFLIFAGFASLFRPASSVRPSRVLERLRVAEEAKRKADLEKAKEKQ